MTTYVIWEGATLSDIKEKHFQLLKEEKQLRVKRLKENADYVICEDGNVFRLTAKGHKEVRGTPRTTGYLSVTIAVAKGKRKDFLIHRLVAEYFIPNPENLPVTNHKDGNKGNNCVNNLEWTTYKENTRHAFETGLMGKGNEHPRSVLTEKDVIAIRKKSLSEQSTLSLAKEYNVSWSTMDSVRKGITWRHVK
jgi:hypothetical protein